MEAMVKIKLKQRHPKGMMYHGRHTVTTEFQTLMFNADEMQALKGDGPKHWFEFKVMKELTKKDQKELNAMKKEQQEAEELKRLEEEEAKQKAKDEEKARLDKLEKEALIEQQKEEDRLKKEQEEAAEKIRNENKQG